MYKILKESSVCPTLAYILGHRDSVTSFTSPEGTAPDEVNRNKKNQEIQSWAGCWNLLVSTIFTLARSVKDA